MVACSFEGTGIHHKGRQGEQLDYNRQTGEQAGYVIFQRKLVGVCPVGN